MPFTKTPNYATTKSLSQSQPRRILAFTLIELLAVIAVIGILAAILIPAISSVRKKAQASEAVSNMRQFGLAALTYANENSGTVPGAGNVKGDLGTGLAGRLFPYLAGKPNPGWGNELRQTFTAIRDPAVPHEISKGNINNGMSWTFVQNAIFNQHAPQNQPLRSGRRLINFERPGAVIYAASGSSGGTGDRGFLVQHAIDPSQRILPTSSARRGFYFAHDGATPAVFLDGHAELMEFPIDPLMVDPDYSD